MTLWSRGFVRSRDKLKSSYLHYHSAHGHQTWQDDDLPWWAPAYKVASWPFDYVVLQDHVTKQNHYISTIRVPMATKLGRMVTHLDELAPTKSHHLLITWFCDKLKPLYLLYHSAYDPQIWQDGNLHWWSSAHKVT